MSINVLMVHGAGPNNWFGGYLEAMRNAVLKKFPDPKQVWVPRAIDWTEYNTLVRLLAQWKDDTILVGLSCGCTSVTLAIAEHSMEKIPYAMLCSPSMFCGVTPLPPNVRRATQVTSNRLDGWNLGARMLVSISAVNKTTALDQFFTGMAHIASPGHPTVVKRLLDEIDLALAAQLKPKGEP